MANGVPVELLAHLRRARDVADRNYAEPLDLAGLVGFSSLGTFSRRFRELVGVTPTAYQRTQAGARVPGCFVFMLGLNSAIPEKQPGWSGPYGLRDDTHHKETP
ncbi:helix-turn-helix domain-containing protein [Kribbella sp. NBC_01505]|uniref:helix-turn-helix domain-containing protein n=1 Tax=Kribbella sp. NBC_01505 TaxID=2903580 RepID=UPI0038695774